MTDTIPASFFTEAEAQLEKMRETLTLYVEDKEHDLSNIAVDYGFDAVGDIRNLMRDLAMVQRGLRGEQDPVWGRGFALPNIEGEVDGSND